MKKLVNGIVQDEKIFDIPIIIDILPKKSNYSNYIVVQKQHLINHETGNPNIGADALMHAKYLKNLTESKSWEFTVDDKRIVQHLPCNIKTYNAGIESGNRLGIGIEICINKDGNFEIAKQNAIKLNAYLMFCCPGLIPDFTDDKTRNTNNIMATVTGHYEWINKNCPARILSEPGKFEAFQQKIINFTLANINSTDTSIDKLLAELKIKNQELESENLKLKTQVTNLTTDNKKLVEYKNDLQEIKYRLSKP